MKIVENRKKFFIGSLIILVLGFAIIAFNAATGKGAFNYDVDFSGGLSINVDIGKEFENADITKIVSEITGNQSPQVQKIGDGQQVSIKIKSVDQETRIKLVQAISEKYGITDENNFTISDISATVSGEMQKTAITALFVACLAMLIYISIRFRDIKTGASAIIALVHDALFLICCYGVLRIPLNITFIVTILTIIGYAINNNIIIFDRLRENKRLHRKTDIGELINKSVNQTFERCMYTTITTLIVVVSLYIFGVPAIKEFALPIIFGLLCGTYTSICFSCSVLYEFEIMKQKKRKK